jgi:peroxiredoxin
MTVPYSARVSRFRKPVRAVVVALALVGSAGGCGPSLPPKPPFAESGAEVDGILPLLDGGEIELATLRGKPLVVHFFTTWSLPAQADLDELRATQEAQPADSFKILGIGLDVDGYKLIAPWRDAAQVDWLVALPSADVTAGKSAFGNVMAEVPSTVLVDAQGQVAWSHRGPLPPGELARRLASLQPHR